MVLNIFVFEYSLSYFLHRYLRMNVYCVFFLRLYFFNLTYFLDFAFIGKIIVLKLLTSFILSLWWLFTVLFFNLIAFITFVIFIFRQLLLIFLLIFFFSTYLMARNIFFFFIMSLKINKVLLFWILNKFLTLISHLGLLLSSANISALRKHEIEN